MPKKREYPYIIHFCKNEICGVAFLDLDLKNSRSPVKWKYCIECVVKGFVNPKKPPVNEERSAAAKERLTRYWDEKKSTKVI